jgi:hypothetical protein
MGRVDSFKSIMCQRSSFTKAALLGLLLPVLANAGDPAISISTPPQIFLDPCWGGVSGVLCRSMAEVGRSLNDAFFLAAASIALAVFVIGAFLMVISAGNDENLQRAKRAMKGSMIGLALITGSYGIYRTMVAILYS